VEKVKGISADETEPSEPSTKSTIQSEQKGNHLSAMGAQSRRQKLKQMSLYKYTRSNAHPFTFTFAFTHLMPHSLCPISHFPHFPVAPTIYPPGSKVIASQRAKKENFLLCGCLGILCLWHNEKCKAQMSWKLCHKFVCVRRAIAKLKSTFRRLTESENFAQQIRVDITARTIFKWVH